MDRKADGQRERGRTTEVGDGIEKGTVPVQMSDFTVSGSGIGGLGLVSGAGCMIMAPRLSDDTLLPCFIGTGCKILCPSRFFGNPR